MFVGVYWQGEGWTSADSAVPGLEREYRERRYDGGRVSPRDALARLAAARS